MLRGRLVALKGKPVEDLKVAADVQWVLNSDRGLSYDDTVPEGSTLVEGTWWGKDYHGAPLVSFESEIAKKLGVGLGDRVTVNVLGRNIEATIANLREVKWESLALNFIMVFSPIPLRRPRTTSWRPSGCRPARRRAWKQAWCATSDALIRRSAPSGSATPSTDLPSFTPSSGSSCCRRTPGSSSASSRGRARTASAARSSSG